jgi:signal transduction histidine kinase
MDRVADFIRREEGRIAQLWEEEVGREVAPLGATAHPVLLDHIHEFLEGLAEWIEGNRARAELAFEQLIQGPALQRLGYGVGLETLTREYSKLRVVLSRELLLHLPATDQIRESMVALHEGLDRAVSGAVHRYAARREEVRERFITILGHDLRDPLSTIAISANTLAANLNLDKEHRVIAARISRTCDRMQRMINDVLDFARGHLGGGIPAIPTRNDMGEICRAAADEIIGANPQRKIEVDIHGNLRGAFDRDRVHQAITNLLANAIHHTDGPIEIRAYEVEDRSAVITEVTSHGAVIPAELQRRIFDPFAAGDPTSPRHGLGLGLYIVQQIALAHGGSCAVVSDDSGTTFTIRWPRTPGAERRVAATG